MRASAPLRPLTFAAAVASLGWSLIAGCFLYDTEYRTQVASITVHQVIFPDSVLVGQADSLVIRARAGFPGCLPAQVSFRRSGDSLVVSGTYSCRYPVPLWRADPGGVRVATPPVSATERRVVLALPDLEAGTYLVVGEPYPLIDTLVVVPQGPVTRHERLTGVGYVWEHSVAGCASPLAYENEPFEHLRRRTYLVENALAPFSSMFAKINATVVGPASCDSSFAGVLHLRHLEPRN